MVLNTEWAQVEVIDLINDGSGLAFGIIGGRSTGVVVKTILPGGVADRDGRLQSGDHILQIGEVNLRGLGSEQVASVLRQCGIHVRMVVARPVESASVDYQALGSQAPIVPTRLLGDPAELDRHLIENGYAESTSQLPASSAFTTPFIYSTNQTNFQIRPVSGAVDVVKNPLPIGNVPSTRPSVPVPVINMLPLDMALHKPNLPEVECYEVELKKDDLGLGITVAGYVCETEEISGIFVKSISPGSAATAGTKPIRVNDRIVEVDGVSVLGQSNYQAVELLRKAGPVVRLKFERYLRGPKYEQLQQAIKANEVNPSQSSTSTVTTLPKIPLSLVKTSFLGIEPEGESRTSFDFDSAVLLESEEIVIDGSSQSHETIYETWRERLGTDAEIVIAEMYKESNGGLGISLEGTVDVEDGKEVRPHHYIRNILPGGPVGQNGTLRSGDELLEVNGIQLLGLNHLEVVAILRQLKNYVCFVCARSSIPIRIIDTSQHRAAFQARKILAGSLQTLIPTSEVTMVKAKSETSLTSSFHSDQCNGSRSRSLEVIAGLPMWQSEPTTIELVKGDYGLGFSILDYQDPLNSQESVIVIRSLVPGGVAQTDGQLIPGDRLLAVNSVNLEHAVLDYAVQVLKSAPKGLVQIQVAKPLNYTHKNGQSYASQDTEEDQTYDDFQECLEEYQECLEVVHICIEDDRSPLSSQMDDLLSNSPVENPPKSPPNSVENPVKCNEEQSVQTSTHKNNNTVRKISNKCGKGDSLTLSMTHSSTQDGYETCIDESLSEEGPHFVEKLNEEITPTNSKLYISDDLTMIDANTPTEEQLKPFDTNHDSDEFILVEYPPELGQGLSIKRPCIVPFGLTEYYNDFEYFMESYAIHSTIEIRREMHDDEIFGDISQSARSHSAPEIITILPEIQIVDEENLHQQYKSSAKRKSLPMTVIETRELEIGKSSGDQDVGNMLDKHWGSTHTVQVFREPNTSLGISIVGGKVDLHPEQDKILGIFVKNVVPNSPAGRSGKFKIGDRILEVSGVDLSKETHEKAVEVIKNAPNPVTFLIQSLIPWKHCEENFDGGKICSSPHPSPVTEPEEKTQNELPKNEQINREEQSEDVTNHQEEEVDEENEKTAENPKENVIVSPGESDDEDEDDVRELEGRTVSSKGQSIDRASAGNIKRTKEEIGADPEEEDDFGYTTNKVKKKYANLGHTILMVQLERSNQGLGLSLAGHKDRNCMAVFVCGMNPNGAAHKTGNIQIGDEILEVNGVVLHGRCHLNASAIIKGLSGPIFKIILLRRKTAVDDIAVKPITQFPVSLAEEASEERFSASYPNVRTVTVKKGSHSLGIMIIEGKHAEVGQGIFISNIQEGSFAEKAGLEIGELILAVNKDSLVGSSYDTATNLLKRTEGLVTLVVSNPSKKTNSITKSNSQLENNKNSLQTSLKTPSVPSRPSTPVPEPLADPASCAIIAGKETTIEITTDNKGLGMFFIGGKDTMIPNGIVVVEVFPGGNADKDNRLRPGDQILECNGVSLKDVSYNTASQALRQTLPKLKMVVYRPERIEYTNLDVDLIKKPGKGLGISVIANKSGKGVYVADVINGSAADVDGKIMRGDTIVSVNDIPIENSSSEDAGLILKTITGRVFLKLNRYKPVAR